MARPRQFQGHPPDLGDSPVLLAYHPLFPGPQAAVANSANLFVPEDRKVLESLPDASNS